LSALAIFLTAAAEDGAKVSDKTGVLSSKAESNPIALALLEQLQRCGLLQQLPGVMPHNSCPQQPQQAPKLCCRQRLTACCSQATTYSIAQA
jgi:hypothetical protein